MVGAVAFRCFALGKAEVDAGQIVCGYVAVRMRGIAPCRQSGMVSQGEPCSLEAAVGPFVFKNGFAFGLVVVGMGYGPA